MVIVIKDGDNQMKGILKALNRLNEIHSQLLRNRLDPHNDMLVLEAQELTQELLNCTSMINDAINCMQEMTKHIKVPMIITV